MSYAPTYHSFHIMLMFESIFFYQRTVNEWNKLSADYVHSNSIKMFKNRIDNYLVRAG